MKFPCISIHDIDTSSDINLDFLNDIFSKKPWDAPAELQLQSFGATPCFDGGDIFVEHYGNQLGIKVALSVRICPPSMVKAKLQEVISEKMAAGHVTSAKEKRSLKAEIETQMRLEMPAGKELADIYIQPTIKKLIIVANSAKLLSSVRREVTHMFYANDVTVNTPQADFSPSLYFDWIKEKNLPQDAYVEGQICILSDGVKSTVSADHITQHQVEHFINSGSVIESISLKYLGALISLNKAGKITSVTARDELLSEWYSTADPRNHEMTPKIGITLLLQTVISCFKEISVIFSRTSEEAELVC